MSKLMSVLGIILLAIGAALALVGFVNPAQMQIHGLSLDTAAILLTGGILSIGLGGVIAALQGYVPAAAVTAPVEAVTPPVVAIPEAPAVVAETITAPAVEDAPAPLNDSAPTRIRFPGFGRKTAAVATAAVVAESLPVAAEPAKSAVDDTIAALEQAKADIANAIGGVSDMATTKVDMATTKVDEVVEDEPAVEEDAEAEAEDGELYVLEEREIRGRPARILSDQTVEAETDEGWMRFENLEHLNEYLDAAGETA
jgi:hypothetical protein